MNENNLTPAAAHLTAADRPRKPIDVNALRALSAITSPQVRSAEEVVRALRDGDRY